MLPRLMAHMTVEDMEQALQQTQTAIIPLGGTEQHGYHLPLSTDLLTSYEVAQAVSERTGCLVASPIYYSYSGGTLKGTTDISPALTTLLVVEIAESLRRQGVRNIIIASGHGGSEHLEAMRAAVLLLRRRHQHLRVELPLLWELSPRFKELFAAGDHHAGATETSLILYRRPDLVRTKAGEPAGADTSGRDVRYDPEWSVGVSGDPFQASVELGRELFEECVAALADTVRALEASEGQTE